MHDRTFLFLNSVKESTYNYIISYIQPHSHVHVSNTCTMTFYRTNSELSIPIFLRSWIARSTSSSLINYWTKTLSYLSVVIQITNFVKIIQSEKLKMIKEIHLIQTLPIQTKKTYSIIDELMDSLPSNQNNNQPRTKTTMSTTSNEVTHP